MGDKLIVCNHCVEQSKNTPYSSPFQFRGFFTNFKVPNNMICPKCNSNLKETSVTMEEIKIIYAISHDNTFIQAMIELKDKDIIEYELKMSQFRNQLNQQKQIESTRKKQESNTVHCPYCNSENIKKISGTERVASATMFGIFSKKIGKSFKCNNCGGTF